MRRCRSGQAGPYPLQLSRRLKVLLQNCPKRRAEERRPLATASRQQTCGNQQLPSKLSRKRMQFCTQISSHQRPGCLFLPLKPCAEAGKPRLLRNPRTPAATGKQQQQEPMSADLAVSHPAASRQDQLAWEQALGPCDQQVVYDACLHQQQRPTSHPAVGATAAECSAWEDALNGFYTPPQQQLPSAPAVYAVVECGSHSTRLLLSTGSSDIARLTRDTHLGAAPGQPAAAAAGTLEAVREFKQVIDQHQQHLKGLAVVATAAVREAAAGPSIAAAVSDVLHCPVQVLTGEQEARLAFKGATTALSSSNSSSKHRCCTCLVLDLGGRSTEFAIGVPGDVPQQAASIPLGCLSISTQASSSSGGDAQHLLQAAQGILDAHTHQLSHISAALRTRRQGEQQPVMVMATGGTVTTLAALHQQLQEYAHEAVHMSVLRRQHVQQLMEQHLHRPAGDVPPQWLTAARASTLAAGCAGLLVLMDWLGVDELVVSDNDLLDGLLS